VPGFIKAVVLDDKTGSTTGWVVAVANNYQNARKAADALKVTWDHGPNAKVSSESLLTEAKRLQGLDDSGLFFVKNGDTSAALGSAAKVLEAEYTTNINIHCPMEPMNATAMKEGDIWHIYTGNQFATRTGGSTSLPYTMPGKKVSMPYFAVPFTLNGISSCGTDTPIMVY
jgi:isoquinoline 1-oxidoreductase beta subunit